MKIVLKEFTYKGWNVKIGYSEESLSKAECDFLGHLYSAHRNINPDNLKYSDILDENGKIDWGFNNENYYLPIAYHEHGNLTLSIIESGDEVKGFDNGFFGVYAINRGNLIKMLDGCEYEDLDEEADKIAREEVQMLQNLLNGEIFYYEAEKSGEEISGGLTLDLDATIQIAKDEIDCEE